MSAGPGKPEDEGGKRWRMSDSEPRAMGLPLSWFRTSESIDLRWIRHPYRWLQWRLDGPPAWPVCA